MIEIKINGVVKWQVSEYTFTDPQMGVRNTSMTVKHPSMWVDGVAPASADFAGAYVEYEEETFYISSSKPTAEKSNSALDYIYTLSFKGEEDDLTRRKVRNLALVGVDNYVSQGTVFNIYADINQFKQLLENNLKYYFGNKWSINLVTSSSDSVRIDVSNVTVWDLLLKSYEYYGVRFNVRGTVINIGYEPDEIHHVFNYGEGLTKITRTAPDASIVNRLSGMGGSRNVPMNYFTDRYSEYTPDPNPINSSVNIRNIMPKVFRDSVIFGDYKDYVEDLASIATHGLREDSLAPNEDIYPSISGIEVPGIGRIDEIIDISEVLTNSPTDEDYSPTFHIWVKDLGFNLADEQYTSTQDAKISFTTGALTGYEFVILANGKIREVIEDTTKSFNGVSSKYRITLINSDEDFDATGRVLPNTVLKPSAGDYFVIYDIELPFVYVKNAEQRVQDWLEVNLADLKEEKPTFNIEPMSSFFETAPVEFDGKTIKEKLRSGNRITINAGVEHKLHINHLTIQYGGILPKYSFTVTDKVQVQGGTVARMQSQLDGVMSRQLLTERDIEALLSGFSTKYLSKIKPDTAQEVVTFLKGIIANGTSHFDNLKGNSFELGDYSSGALGSGAVIKMINGVSYAEVDNLSVRMQAVFRELIIESLKHVGGQIVLTPARMKCVKVEETTDFYRCYFDTGDNGEVVNEFVTGDQARCQVFTGSGTKFYWRLVIAVGTDYIELSKSDAVSGSDISQAGDDIVQLGHRTDTTRQNAQILSTVGADAPSWKQYKGINSFNLGGKETTVFSGLGNRIEGKTVFRSGGSNVDDWGDSIEGDISTAQQAANAAALAAQQAADNAASNVTDYNTKFAEVQAQIDGEVSNWFYAYAPTLEGYPSSDWVTTEEKDRHIGDTFTNTQPFVDNTTTPHAGKSWRFVKNGAVYSWTPIADSDAVKALLEASRAQATADGKSTTHLFQPTKYKLGDMWVLNVDQTVNGTDYKNGEILTATQDSTTFIQSHWVKKVRYTDDTAVDNLEIGGRNLWAVSKSGRGYGYTGLLQFLSTVSVEDYTYIVSDNISDDVAVKLLKQDIKGEYLHVQFMHSQNLPSLTFIITYANASNQSLENLVVTIPRNAKGIYSVLYKLIRQDFEFIYVQLMYIAQNSGLTYPYSFYNVGVYSSNKEVDWTPAPEDVQADIDAEKTRINEMLSDNIADPSEKQYLSNLWQEIYAEYPRIWAQANSYTIDKSNYEAKYTALNNILTPILANLTTSTTVSGASIRTAFSQYYDARTVLQNAITNKVNTNASNAQTSANNANTAVGSLNTYVEGSFKDGVIEASEAKAIEKYINIVNTEKSNLEATYNKLYVNTYLEGIPKTDLLNAKVTYFGAVTTLINSITTAISDGKTTVLEKQAVDTSYGSYKTALVSLQTAIESANKAIQDKLKSYSDTAQTSASNAASVAADAQAKALSLEYLKQAIGQDAVINGALYTVVTLLLKENMNAAVTAGLSGIQEGPAFWAGGTYEEAINNLAKAIIRHDGSVKFTDAEITGTINAKNGIIEKLTMASNGVIELPPMFSSSIKGRITSEGINLVYQGSNSQKIEWYTGTGTYAGSISPNNQGHLNIESSFGVSIQSQIINIGTEAFVGTINIGSGLSEIDLQGSSINNIREMTNIGYTTMASLTFIIADNTMLLLRHDVPLSILTYVGSNSYLKSIYMNNNNLVREGAMKWILNRSGSTLNIAIEGNIRISSGDTWKLQPNSLTPFIYSAGYWYKHSDWT